MSILLVIPPKETIFIPDTPPLSFAYLSAILKRDKIEHRITDLKLYKNWKEVLDAKIKNYSIFGITSTTYEFKSAIEVAKFIKKKNPDSKIIMGGAHPTLMAKEIIEGYKEIDYCIRGEGENNLPGLIHLIESGNEESIERIKGVCYKREEEISCNPLEPITELDNIPFPNYDKFELNRYSSFPEHLYILTSRGCPFNCIYCSIGLIMGRRFRARSPKSVVDEIEHMSAKYGASLFEFRDDNFTFDIKRAKQICERIISKNLSIKWCADIRVDRIDEELVGLMKESGCIRLDIGIESANNEILRNLRRGMTREQIERGISLIKKHKIPIKGYFIIGSPGETYEDAISSLEFAIRKDLDEASFYMLTPYPGTELWNWVEKNGYWTVNNPLEEVTGRTHQYIAKAIYETPYFLGNVKEKNYEEIKQKWNGYKLGKTLKGFIILILKRYPHIYQIARKLHQFLHLRI